MRLSRKQRKERKVRRTELRNPVRKQLRCESLEPRQLLTTWFVDADLPTGSGTTWTDPFSDLQDALSIATAGDEIWVAEGSYTPGTNRHASFHMKSGVDMYGGFQGVSASFPTGEYSVDQRDWSSNQTILNGDINQDDDFTMYDSSYGFGVDGLVMDILFNEENSHHVVSGADDARLDGFYVQGGNANGVCGSPSTPMSICYPVSMWSAVYEKGGGLHAPNGTPTVENVVFRFNSAIDGGAVYTEGGQLSSFDEPNFRNVVFHNNLAESRGAGIYNNGSDIYLENAVFYKNYVFGSAGLGGGMMISGGETIIVNSTFYGNWAGAGGALAIRTASPVIINSILHGDGAITASGTQELYHTGGGQIFAAHSNFDGGLPANAIDAGGNIDAWPEWAAPDTALGPDQTWATSDDGLQLNGFSPSHDTAIDSILSPNGVLVEAPEDDILGTLRLDVNIAGDGIDMGAYEVYSSPVIIIDPPGFDPPGVVVVIGEWQADWARGDRGERGPDEREDLRKPQAEKLREAAILSSLAFLDHQGKDVAVIADGVLESKRLTKESKEQMGSKEDFFHRLGLDDFLQKELLMKRSARK